MSKFLDLLKSIDEDLKKNHIIVEDTFVRGNEKSELPDAKMQSTTDDDSDKIEGDVISPDDTEGVEDIKPEISGDSFSDREVDILNIALQLYRNDSKNPIELKNELSELYDNKEYDTLMSRLIAIADEFNM